MVTYLVGPFLGIGTVKEPFIALGAALVWAIYGGIYFIWAIKATGCSTLVQQTGAA